MAYLRKKTCSDVTDLIMSYGGKASGWTGQCMIDTEVIWPHTHFVGKFGGCQLYHKLRASQKALLCNTKQWASRGRADNQCEAPQSWATSKAFWPSANIDALSSSVSVLAVLCLRLAAAHRSRMTVLHTLPRAGFDGRSDQSVV